MSDCRLKIDARRNAILKKIRQNKRVTVAELSHELDATGATIRNDLSVLEQEGHLVRTQGGAILLQKFHNPTDLTTNIPNPTSKLAIACAVSEMIQDGDTLFINSGTTTACVADALKCHKDLKIVTNSLAVANTLADISSLRVTLLGGDLNARYGFTYGSITQDLLSQFQANWAILSVDGLSPIGGITTYHSEEAILDRMMINGAQNTLIVADRGKLGHIGFSRICDCNGLTLVTNSSPETGITVQLKECGLHIKYV